MWRVVDALVYDQRSELPRRTDPLVGMMASPEIAELVARAVNGPDEEVPRCPLVQPTPWGPAQCALPAGHEEHRFSPSEADEHR